MGKASIQVRSEVAEAFQNASAEQQRRAEIAMAAALLSREDAVQELEHLLDRMSDYAETQGLTPDRLDALLHADD